MPILGLTSRVGIPEGDTKASPPDRLNGDMRECTQRASTMISTRRFDAGTTAAAERHDQCMVDNGVALLSPKSTPSHKFGVRFDTGRGLPQSVFVLSIPSQPVDSMATAS